MSTPTTIRAFVVGLLVLALASSAYASVTSQSRVSPPPVEANAFIEAAWEWILDVFVPRPDSSVLDRSTEKTEQGSQLDPDGNH